MAQRISDKMFVFFVSSVVKFLGVRKQHWLDASAVVGQVR
jgi:hypothetical protein